jgi:hypothetical protein
LWPKVEEVRSDRRQQTGADHIVSIRRETERSAAGSHSFVEKHVSSGFGSRLFCLAARYVGISWFEHVFYVAAVVGLLIMLTVSLSEAVGTPGSLDLLVGAVLLALHDRR